MARGQSRQEVEHRSVSDELVTASAAGAALVGFATDLPVWALLLLVASSPLLAGVTGTVLLVLGSRRSDHSSALGGEQDPRPDSRVDAVV